MTRHNTLNSITYSQNLIRQSDKLHDAILYHHDLVINEFQRSPLFLKFLFKTSRFILCETFLSQFFLHPEITITDVKQVFNKFNLLSENSIDSFFTLLKWSGRIKLESSENDKRKK